MDQIN